MKINNSLVKNFSYSFFSNIISLVISTMVVVLIPKVINVSEYGYFQLYVFYSSYVGFFHLGWCDGIYLRNGGEYYDRLDRKQMGTQFWLLVFLESVVTIILLIAVFVSSPEEAKGIVLALTVLSIIVVIPKTMLAYMLQMTNRIKENSIVAISEKVVYGSLVAILIIIRNQDFYMYVFADLFGKLVSLIVSVIYCSDIVFSRFSGFMSGIKEAIINISIGSKLMVANIAGMLILGVVRISIESHWSIEVFGKVSLAISVSNLMMVFINAVAIVLFPLIKRMDSDKVSTLYDILRDLLMILLFVGLIFYYPLKEMLLLWLPNYKESFTYMAILFPMCIYECKMSMLVSTYLKAYRKEKLMLYINISTVILSVICSYVFIYIMNNLELTVFSLFCVFAFRCILSEIFLCLYIRKRFTEDLIIEFMMCIVFISAFYFANNILSFIIYFVAVAVYLLYKRKAIKLIIARTSSFVHNRV